MRVLWTVALAAALATVPGVCIAQQGAGQMPRAQKAAPQVMTGKVTQVDARAKRFTIMARGKSLTFSAEGLKALPKIGDSIDVTYVVTRGELMKAINLNLSKSNVN